jgi:hypothetical protein
VNSPTESDDCRTPKAPPDLAIRAEVRRVVVDEIIPDLPRIVSALKVAAFGAKVVGSGADAGEVACTTAPDVRALACLLSMVDRVA